MKGKFRSMWRVTIALVLVLTLGLVAAVPAVASPGYVGFQFGKDTGLAWTSDVTAEWAEPLTEGLPTDGLGNYSAKLSHVTITDGNLYIEFIPAPGITVDDLATIGDTSFWYYLTPDGWGPALELYFTSVSTEPHAAGSVEITIEPVQTNPAYDTWDEAEVTTTTFTYFYGNTPDDVSFSGGFDPAGTLGGVLTAIDVTTEMDAESASAADWELTRVRVQLWNGGARDCYIDDVTIDGTLYELEPVFLDAEYYSVGDTVEVTVPNFAANTDPIRINPVATETAGIHTDWEVSATSTSDASSITIDLEETGANTGVFTGSFTTTGTLPVAEDEVYVEDGATITVTYLTSVGWGAVAVSSTSIDVLVDDTAPTITGLTTDPSPDAGIVYSSTPTISATLSDADASGIDPDTGVMTVNGDVVAATFVTNGVSYPVDPALDPGTVVEVTVDVDDNMGNAAETAELSFTIADDFNVSLGEGEDEIAAVATTPITAIFTDVYGRGPGDAETLLDTVKVTLSGVGVDLASGDYIGDDGDTKVDATSGDTSSLTFDVTPEQAGTITVTFVGTFDDESVVTKTLDIDVTGFLVAETWTDVDLGTTGDISMTVTTKAGAAVNTGIVTITAPAAGGFEKDVNDDGELESFLTIVFNGSASTIKYGDNPEEDFSVIGGVYEVTGIKFVEVGAVVVLVEDAATAAKAKFLTAFTVLGNDVYSLSFDPTQLTAGVDLGALDIAITEAGEPVTDVDSITISEMASSPFDVSAQEPPDGVYTIDPALVSEEKIGDDALVVMAKNADDTKYGTDTLEVGLPTVSYTFTEEDSTIPRDVMIISRGYTVSVTVIDALEALLDGYLWIGTYDEETGFDRLAPQQGWLVVDGAAEFTVDAPDLAGSVVWKVGSGEEIADAALVLTPAIAVEDFYYDLNPTEATVDVDTTYTVTDNYLEVAGNLDVKIVTPGGDVVNKVTTPVGTFKYTAPEVGDYYVSVNLNGSWQDPITVTVSEPAVDKGDFDGDGDIDLADFVAFVAAYGSSTGDANYNVAGDFDDDGDIDLADFVAFVAVYGT